MTHSSHPLLSWRDENETPSIFVFDKDEWKNRAPKRHKLWTKEKWVYFQSWAKEAYSNKVPLTEIAKIAHKDTVWVSLACDPNFLDANQKNWFSKCMRARFDHNSKSDDILWSNLRQEGNSLGVTNSVLDSVIYRGHRFIVKSPQHKRASESNSIPVESEDSYDFSTEDCQASSIPHEDGPSAFSTPEKVQEHAVSHQAMPCLPNTGIPVVTVESDGRFRVCVGHSTMILDKGALPFVIDAFCNQGRT